MYGDKLEVARRKQPRALAKDVGGSSNMFL